jgi:toxin ParE1/3/4
LIVEWTLAAEQDRAAHVEYIAQDSPRAAVEVGDEIEHQVEGLAEYPKLGRTGRVRGTRERVITGTPYIVAYRIKGETVQILRVLHGAQQWPKGFSRR